MVTNGRRRPPRPRIRLAGGAPSAEEAAAIAAALEQHLAEIAPPTETSPKPSPWLRAALIEGVSAHQPPVPPAPGTGFPVR